MQVRTVCVSGRLWKDELGMRNDEYKTVSLIHHSAFIIYQQPPAHADGSDFSN